MADLPATPNPAPVCPTHTPPPHPTTFSTCRPQQAGSGCHGAARLAPSVLQWHQRLDSGRAARSAAQPSCPRACQAPLLHVPHSLRPNQLLCCSADTVCCLLHRPIALPQAPRPTPITSLPRTSRPSTPHPTRSTTTRELRFAWLSVSLFTFRTCPQPCMPPPGVAPHPTHTRTCATHAMACSNRLGIRMEGPRPKFARLDGGEGGSHPSNVHDHVYALGEAAQGGPAGQLVRAGVVGCRSCSSTAGRLPGCPCCGRRPSQPPPTQLVACAEPLHMYRPVPQAPSTSPATCQSC